MSTTIKSQWEVWSNIPFMLVGAWVLFAQHELWGLGVFFMGLASFYSHITRQFKIDWIAMYVCFGLMGGSFFVKDSLILMMVTNAVFVGAIVYHDKLKAVKWKFPLKAHYVAVGVLYALMAIGSFYVATPLAASISIALFGIGFLVRQMFDHGTWHIILAIAIGILKFEI
jgi:hypothetical protein